jgi:hypothetical protein
MCQFAEEVDEDGEEDEQACPRGRNFMAVGSVKPVIATLYLRVISVPKAKKKNPKKRRK